MFVMMLTPLFWIGLGGAKAAFASFLLGGALWALAAIWVYQLARRMMGGHFAAITVALVLANGHLLWNFLSGMETGLVAVLLLGEHRIGLFSGAERQVEHLVPQV